LFYGEGYLEEDIRSSLEGHFKIKKGSLDKGLRPDYKNELVKLWDRNNKKYKLTLNKSQTTSKEKIYLYKKQQHVKYELKLLLSENNQFLTGTRGDVIADPENEVRFLNSKYITNDGYEVGDEVCYSFRGSTELSDTCKIYRFHSMYDAYHYVRNQIIKFKLSDVKYNKNFTCLEMCDSFITGFGNSEWIVKNASLELLSESKLNYNSKFDV